MGEALVEALVEAVGGLGEALALAGWEAVGEALEELVEVLQARNESPSQRGILSHLRLGHARQIDSQ